MKLEELCTIKQACFSEQAGRTTIYKRIKEGHYKAYKIGGSTRLSVASLKAYRFAVLVNPVAMPLSNPGAHQMEVK
jgi:excisionase family DNA binding protein